MAFVLWNRFLKFNPKNPHEFNRDRFILSAGHGCMLQYALLHLTGFDLSLDDLKQFRQLHSRTPGHPENTETPGVEMATGPLGQGLAHCVGFAIAEKILGGRFNRPGATVVDHYTYTICSDGDLMEGVTNEAGSLAGHLELGKLIALYDDNGITIDGPTSISFTEDVAKRYEALGWHIQHIDGNDLAAIDSAIRKAQGVTNKPSLILAKTVIGFGSPTLQGTNKIHSNPISPEETIKTKEALGLPTDKFFYIADDVLAEMRKAVDRGAQLHEEFKGSLAKLKAIEPALAAELEDLANGKHSTDWVKALPTFTDKMATRKASEGVIQAIFPHMPTLVGGSADLSESNLTDQKGQPFLSPEVSNAKNIHFGVREHAMATAVNGITLHGGLRAYGASFMVFTDYCRPALRLAALMHCPSIFIFTHDSIGVGEDGPTHEPVEHLTALRVIPNFNVFRPADGNETSVAWKVALESQTTPTLLALSRQALPALTPDTVQNHPAEKGAYILKEASGGKPSVTLVSSGSEVQHCVAAQAALEGEGIPTRVVSFPSWFLFQKQDGAYQKSVIDLSIPTLAVEAGSGIAWPRYSHAQVCIDRFGLSGPGDQVMKEFGFTPENVIAQAKKLIGK